MRKSFRVGDKVAWTMRDGNVMVGDVTEVVYDILHVRRVDGGSVTVNRAEVRRATPDDTQTAIDFYTRKGMTLPSGVEKTMKRYGKKQMPEEEVPVDAVPEEEGELTPEVEEETKDLVEEPMGAQAYRRLHQDASILMEDYHDILQTQDEPGVRARIESKLESIANELDEIEQEFSGHERYKELPPLEGAMGEEDSDEGSEEGEEGGETEAAEADSGEREEVPEEEVIEGMSTKSLREKYIKALRKDYRKSVCAKCKAEGKESCDCVKSLSKERSLVNKKDLTDDEADKIKNEIDKEKEDTEKALPQAAKSVVGEALGFLKFLGGVETKAKKKKGDGGFGARYNGALEYVTDGAHPDDVTASERKQAAAIAAGGKSLTDGGKKDAYYLHKALARLLKDFPPDDVMGDPTMGGSEPLSEEDEPKSMDWHKAVGDACQLFKALSESGYLDDDMKMKCAGMAKALEESMGPPEDEIDNIPDMEPGEMGEKELAREVQRQKSVREKLNKKLEVLSGLLVNR